MNDKEHFEKLDMLLARSFKPGGPGATPGFEARVMASILSTRRQDSLWDVLRAAARPLLVSGWAAAAILGFLALRGLGASDDAMVAAFMNGGAAARWLVM